MGIVSLGVVIRNLAGPLSQARNAERSIPVVGCYAQETPQVAFSRPDLRFAEQERREIGPGVDPGRWKEVEG